MERTFSIIKPDATKRNITGSINKIIEENNSKLAGRVVTKLSPLKNYCKAEEYHQKYLDK